MKYLMYYVVEMIFYVAVTYKRRVYKNKHKLKVFTQTLKFQLWGEHPTNKLFNITRNETTEEKDNDQNKGPKSQGCLNDYFTEYNQIRLPRK